MGIRKTRNTDDFLGSGTKLLFTFMGLRFFDMRRERHNFFLCWLFYLTPPRTAPRRKLLVWPQRVPEIDFLPLASNLNKLFFFKFQNPQPIASGHDVIRVPGPIFYLGFYCDICDCHIPPARAWTPALNVRTYLTHARSRKVLSLTKPKGKRNETKNDNIKKKSIRNYITRATQSQISLDLIFPCF